MLFLVVGFYSKLVRLKVARVFVPIPPELSCFYSKLVRLKVEKEYPTRRVFSLFLFQIGAIKSVLLNWHWIDNLKSFYSKLVRLKVCSVYYFEGS